MNRRQGTPDDPCRPRRQGPCSGWCRPDSGGPGAAVGPDAAPDGTAHRHCRAQRVGQDQPSAADGGSCAAQHRAGAAGRHRSGRGPQGGDPPPGAFVPEPGPPDHLSHRGRGDCLRPAPAGPISRRGPGAGARRAGGGRPGALGERPGPDTEPGPAPVSVPDGRTGHGAVHPSAGRTLCRPGSAGADPAGPPAAGPAAAADLGQP